MMAAKVRHCVEQAGLCIEEASSLPVNLRKPLGNVSNWSCCAAGVPAAGARTHPIVRKAGTL